MLRIDPILPYEAPPEGLRPDDHDSIDTDAIIRFIRKRRRLCLTWLAGGVVAGVILAAIMPAHYTASTSVLLEGASRPLDGAPAVTDAANSTYVETQVQVLSSDEVIGRVVDRKNLTSDTEFGGNSGLKSLLKTYLRAVLGSEAKTKAPDRRYATIVRVRRALSVARVGTSNVVDVRFTSLDPVRSATIANAIVQSYVEARLVLQRAAREEAAAGLRQQLAALREKAFPTEPPQEAAAPVTESAAQARAHFREAQDSLSTYRAMYDRLLQRVYGDADSGAGVSNIRVITPAEPPLFAGSQLIIVLAVAGVAGVGGLGHALLRDMTDRRITAISEVAKVTGLPCITGIPKLGPGAWQTDDDAPGYLQPAYTKVSGLICEKMARLAVTLQEGQARRTGWIIAVSSPDEGAGASSVAAHFARVIAESGQKTVLVDANWRKPLAGEATASPGLNRKLTRGLATMPLDSEALEVIVLRATTPISELNASLSIGSALKGLGADYDFVVVDLHSCGQTADMAAGSVQFHELIVVAQAGLTTSDRLAAYLSDLPRDKIAAVILNMT
jgi:capsular polysaccharide biosynthesis protein/Mrp family chromosome partitioning ATPase